MRWAPNFNPTPQFYYHKLQLYVSNPIPSPRIFDSNLHTFCASTHVTCNVPLWRTDGATCPVPTCAVYSKNNFVQSERTRGGQALASFPRYPFLSCSFSFIWISTPRTNNDDESIALQYLKVPLQISNFSQYSVDSALSPQFIWSLSGKIFGAFLPLRSLIRCLNQYPRGPGRNGGYVIKINAFACLRTIGLSSGSTILHDAWRTWETVNTKVLTHYNDRITFGHKAALEVDKSSGIHIREFPTSAILDIELEKLSYLSLHTRD